MRTGTKIVIGVVLGGLLAAPALAIPAVFEMEVVEINGAPITPSTDVTVNNGDQFKVEYFVRSWAPQLALTFQVRVDGASLFNGLAGSLHLAELACADDVDCQGNGDDSATCDVATGLCACRASVYVVANNTDRVDYIFFNIPEINAPDCTSAQAMARNYGFGATLFNPNLAVADTGSRAYVGTVILEVDDDACGDFTVGILNDPNQTFLLGADDEGIAVDLSATITVRTPPQCATTGACCDRATWDCVGDVFEADCAGEWTEGVLCGDLAPPCAPRPTFVAADPPGCAIDARQPHDPDNAALRYGWDSFVITLNADGSADSLTPADFAVAQYPNDTPAPPAVVAVSAVFGNTVEVQLSGPINEGKWTCLSLAGDASQDFCWGHLPADVDSSGDSNPSDIIAVIDCINDVASIACHPWQADLDRSGGVDPSDIIAVIDLLNGASAFQPWFGRTLSPRRCPG